MEKQIELNRETKEICKIKKFDSTLLNVAQQGFVLQILTVQKKLTQIKEELSRPQNVEVARWSGGRGGR